MRLGGLLSDGNVICLQGDLGTGKTTLVQGVAQGWGSLDAVTSPTFVLVNVYRRPDTSQLFHLDAYRLESAIEAEDLDLGVLLGQGPLVIEWPERIEPALPVERFWVKLTYLAEEQREMTFTARGERYESLLLALRKNLYGVV